MDPLFPIGPRASLTPALIETFEQCYGLGPAHASRDLGGAYNLNALLETPLGAYVLRVYRPWVMRERLSAVQAFKQQLLAEQIPVVLPLRTVTGQTLIELEQRVVEVEPYVAHRGGADSWERYREAFTLLGQFHRICAGRLNATNLPAPAVQNDVEPATLMAWVDDVRRMASASSTGPALALCDETLRLLHPIDVWWQQEGRRLPRTLTHGDYGGENVLFADGRIIALVDFDFLAVRERVFDVAYSLYWMFVRLEPEVACGRRSWQRLPEMLACYDTAGAQPLSQDERRAIVTEMARTPLYWVGESAFLSDPVKAVMGCADGVAHARWLMDHRDELTQLLD